MPTYDRTPTEEPSSAASLSQEIPASKSILYRLCLVAWRLEAQASVNKLLKPEEILQGLKLKIEGLHGLTHYINRDLSLLEPKDFGDCARCNTPQIS